MADEYNAEKARKDAEDYLHALYTKEFSEIIQSIESHAKRGLRSLYISGTTNDRVIEKLKELNFLIDVEPSEMSYVVRWPLPSDEEYP